MSRRVKNVLFITADQWRGECLSALGHKTVRTPNLDALARESVLFANHFANTAPCSPSRATLHTGLYQHNHRVAMNGTPLDARHTNWALETRKAGYDPLLIGYTDQTPDPRELESNDPRLRTYEGVLPGLNAIALTGTDPGPWAEYLIAKGYPVPENRELTVMMRAPGPDYEDGAPHPKPLAIKAEDDDTAWHVDRAIETIDARRNEPWALHLSLLRPHPPWIAAEPWNRMYDPAAVDMPTRSATPDGEAAQHPWLRHQLSRKLYRAPADEKKQRRFKAVYFGLMSEVDHHLGRLFAHLKRQGLWDDTLIVFTSDHGEQMGDHWLVGKCGYFDQSYRVPLIVRDPSEGAARGARVSAFTEHVDIMPTLLDALGLDLPPQLDGFALTPFLKGAGAPAWRDAAHVEYDFRDASDPKAEEELGLTLDECNLAFVRDARFKYVHFAGLEPLLFDLARDPHETTDRAADPDYARVAFAYAQKLMSWRMRHDDRTLSHMMATRDGMIARKRT